MNPYLARHVGIVEFPSDIHLIILSASSSTKPSLDGTQSSSVEESPLSPHSQTQSTAFLPLHLSPRRPSHIALSCLSPPSRSCLLSSRSYLLSSRSCLLSSRSYPLFLCLLSSRSYILSKSRWVLSRYIMKSISDQNQ